MAEKWEKSPENGSKMGFWDHFCHFSAIFLPISPGENGRKPFFGPFSPDFGPKARDQSKIAGQRGRNAIYDFLGGCFGPPSCCFSIYNRPKTPPKRSYSKCLRGTQIRWAIWRSSKFVALRHVSLWKLRPTASQKWDAVGQILYTPTPPPLQLPS